jgi:hypothetical protein
VAGLCGGKGVAVPGIVVAAAGGVVVYLECCSWPVWDKVAVPGIIVAAAVGVAVYLELLWLACVG